MHEKINFSSTSNPINTDVLLKQLDEGTPYIETAHRKEVVLVLGKTGAGKSTTVNYLLGVRMEEKEDDRGNFIVEAARGEATYATIGHTATSCTLYPTVYAKPGSALGFGDCPGFGDTRGREEQITVSVSIELAVKKAKCIKAIVVVVSQDELIAGRGEVFKNISSMLGKLIQNPQSVKDSILFVITKPDIRRTTYQGILNKVQDIANATKNQITTLGERYKGSKDKPKEIQDEEDKLSILSLITEKNLFVIDVLEQSTRLDRRDKLLDFISRAYAIPMQQFRFNAYDEGRSHLNHLLSDIVTQGNALFERVNQLPIEINNNKNEIENAKQINETYSIQIDHMQFNKKLNEIKKEITKNTHNEAIKANKMQVQKITDMLVTYQDIQLYIKENDRVSFSKGSLFFPFENAQYIKTLESKIKALENPITQLIKQNVLDLERKNDRIQEDILTLEKQNVMDKYEKENQVKDLEKKIELNKVECSKKEKEIILKTEKLQTTEKNIKTEMSKFEMVERMRMLDLAVPGMDKFSKSLTQYKQLHPTLGNKVEILKASSHVFPFNVDVLLKQLDEGTSYIETAHQKEVVLVVGQTGVGKSTTVNYLLGTRMEEREDDRNYNFFVDAARGEKIYAPIGHTAASCTLYPTVYVKPGSALGFGDCPGFGDMRSKEEQITVSVSIELTVKKAKCIKAIMVVVSQDELITGRSEVFKNISSMLGKLIQNPQSVKDSILFVITKPDIRRTTYQGILNKVQDIANATKNQITTLGERYKGSKDKPKEIQDEEDKLSILSLITEKNLFVIDVLEQSTRLDRRDKLLDFINKSNAIPMQQFRFNPFDEGRSHLNRLISDIVTRGNDLFERVNQLPIEINNNNKNAIENAKKTNETHIRQIDNIISCKKLMETEKEKTRKACNDVIKANKMQIQNYQEQIKNKEKDKKNKEREIKIYDSDELATYRNFLSYTKGNDNAKYIKTSASDIKYLDTSINELIQSIFDLERKNNEIQEDIIKFEKQSVMDEYRKEEQIKNFAKEIRLNEEECGKKVKEIILKTEELQRIEESIKTEMSKFEMVERMRILDLAVPGIDKFFKHLNQYRHQFTVGNKETITTASNNPSPFFVRPPVNTRNEKVERGNWEKNWYF